MGKTDEKPVPSAVGKTIVVDGEKVIIADPKINPDAINDLAESNAKISGEGDDVLSDAELIALGRLSVAKAAAKAAESDEKVTKTAVGAGIKNVTVRSLVNDSATIGATTYHFKEKQTYEVPPDVAVILQNTGWLIRL